MFLGKILYSHSASFHPGNGWWRIVSLMKCWGGGGNLAMNWHFIQGRVAPSRGGGVGGEKDGQLAQIYSLASKADLLNEKATIIV